MRATALELLPTEQELISENASPLVIEGLHIILDTLGA